MKITFTNPMPNRVATEVIARQPIEYLRMIGVDANYVPEPYFSYDCDIAVFSKQCNIDIARSCKEKGIKTIWFADDGLFYKQAERIIRENHYLDAIISTCEANMNLLRSLGFKTQIIETIYHHHCNFKNETPEFRTDMKNVGYVGVFDQFHHPETVTRHVEDLKMTMQIRDQKDIRYSDLDVGIAFLDKNYADKSGLAEYIETSWHDRLLNRSNAKIVNHMSYGIPTIASRYSSYLEIDKIAPGCAVFCDSIEEVKSSITELHANSSMRHDMYNKCLDNRDKFHLKNIVKNYKNLFDSVL